MDLEHNFLLAGGCATRQSKVMFKMQFTLPAIRVGIFGILIWQSITVISLANKSITVGKGWLSNAKNNSGERLQEQCFISLTCFIWNICWYSQSKVWFKILPILDLMK